MVDQPPVQRLHPTVKLPPVVVRRKVFRDEPGHRSVLIDAPSGPGPPPEGRTRSRGRIKGVPELVEEVERHHRGRRRRNDLLGPFGGGGEYERAHRATFQLGGVANTPLTLGIGAEFDSRSMCSGHLYGDCTTR